MVEAGDEEEGSEYPRDNPALRAPAAYMSLFRTLQEYLLRTEYHLWGVLDKHWAGAPAALPSPGHIIL